MDCKKTKQNVQKKNKGPTKHKQKALATQNQEKPIGTKQNKTKKQHCKRQGIFDLQKYTTQNSKSSITRNVKNPQITRNQKILAKQDNYSNESGHKHERGI